MTPAQKAAAAAYYGVPTRDLGDIDSPGYIGEVDDPGAAARQAQDLADIEARNQPRQMQSFERGVTDLGEIDPPGTRPFSWNAPGYEGVQQKPFAGSPPEQVTHLGEIDSPPPVPSFARGPAQPDTEPAKSAVTPESAAAAKALAYYGGAGKPAAGRGGAVGGGGAPAGPSEYARGVAGLRGTYGDDKGAVQRGATAEEQRSDLIAQGTQDLAQKKQDDEAIQRVEAANAAKTFADYSAETQRQIDEVRAKKIDPNEGHHSSEETFINVLGGALGGMYMGLNHQTQNPFLEQLNKQIDQRIRVQESNRQNMREGIADRKGVLAEMRATYKDEQLAKLQARNLYYEAAKEDLAGQAATYDSPAIQARADQAINAISREQSKLDINEAMRKAAAAAAAATAAEHRRQIDFENRLKLQHMQNETLTAGANAIKAVKEGGKEHQAAVAHVGDKLSDIDKQGFGTDVERLHRYLIDPKTGQVDYSRSIPGVGRMADLRENIAPPLGRGGALDIAGAAGPAGWVARGGTAAVLGLSPEERQNKNAMDRVFLGFKNIKTGSAASETEAARISDAYFGAKTPEEVASAVDQSYNFLQRNKDAIRAENPEATAEYEANQRALTAKDRAGTVRREAPK